MPLKKLYSSSERETKKFGADLGLRLRGGDVVFLEGELGSGKTTLIKGIGSAFGVEEERITSPTFPLMHIYTESLIHFDLYRLKGIEEFIQAGLEEYLAPPYITLVEWPAILRPLIKTPLELCLHHLGEGKREILYDVKFSEMSISHQQ